MHSAVISKLSKDHDIGKLKANWGEGLGSGEQLEKASSKGLEYNSNIEPKTYICDIDGVLLEHSKGRFSHKQIAPFSDNAKSIKTNVGLINGGYDNGDRIILFTSRSEEDKENTEKQLEQNGIRYDKLILGNSSGTRILINDKKALKDYIDTAVAINTKRNCNIGTLHVISADSTEGKSKGSGANTEIITDKTSNTKIVRKWSDPYAKEISSTLYKQMNYMKTINQQGCKLFPEVVNYRFSNEEVNYYDMEVARGNTLTTESLTTTDAESVVADKLRELYNASRPKKVHWKSYSQTLVDIIDTKLIKSILHIKSFLKGKKFANISEKEIEEICEELQEEVLRIKENSNNYWRNHQGRLIHGDLTLENMLFDERTRNLTLIDPLGSTMDPAANRNFNIETIPVFDLGKIMQSTVARYEAWSKNKEISNEEKKEYCKKINKDDVDLYSFYNIYEEYLGNNYIADGLVALITILIRVAPYRIEAGEPMSAIICLMKARQVAKAVE